MLTNRFLAVTAVLAFACGGGKPSSAADSTARDLSLAPAESVATLSDQPQPGTGQARQAQPSAAKPAANTPAPRPAAPKSMTLVAGEGTVLMLAANDTLTSRHNKRGETVTATLAGDVQDTNGRTVIPAGAVLTGTISDIAPAEHPGGQGRMVLTFTQVEFGGNAYPITARTDSIASHMKGRGVTGGEAAKVGAATAVGAVAGAIIGKNAKGAAIGGAVGAAAGVGIAAATRDIDILLDAGATIRLVLTQPFEVTVRG
jgi:hypothetical protein